MTQVVEPVVEDLKTAPTTPPTEAPTTPPTEAPTTPPTEAPVDVEDIKRKAFGHALKQVDDTLSELGFPKPDGVKTSEYLKQVLTEQIAKQSKQPSGTPDDKDTIINQLKATLAEKDSAITELQSSTSKAKKEIFVESLLSQAKLNIPENLNDTEKARMSSVLKGALKAELEREIDFKEVDGKFIAYQKDGAPVLDEKADYLDPSKLIEKNFSVFLAKPEASPKPAGTGGVRTEPKAQTIPSTVKTKHDYYNHLIMDKGMTMGSKDFNESVAKAKEENPQMFA